MQGGPLHMCPNQEGDLGAPSREGTRMLACGVLAGVIFPRSL